MKKLFKANQKGFTLIELLIVIAILGILVAVAIPSVTGFMKSGNVSAANTELNSLQLAVMGYQADHNGNNPSDVTTATNSLTDLASYLSNPTTVGKYTMVGGVITGSEYKNGSTTLTWDTTNKKWK